MKKIGFLAILLVASFGIFSSKAKAQRVDFNITTAGGKAWAYDYSNTSINDTNKYSAVNWQTSNRGNHTMWFGVFDQSYFIKGSLLFTSKKTDAFLTSSLSANSSYMLGARRENSGDPATNVTGLWTA